MNKNTSFLQEIIIPENITIVRNLSYRNTPDTTCKLDLYFMDKKGPVSSPAIVFIHGGSWQEGDKSNPLYIENCIKYAHKGYICVTANYRLSHEKPFPAAVEDVKCAVRWLRAHADECHIDTEKIGAMGNSAGGHLVSMLGLVPAEAGMDTGQWENESSQIQAAVNICGPANLAYSNKQIVSDQIEAVDLFLAGPKETLSERQKTASPINYVSKEAPPFLIIHGTEDKTVPVLLSDEFYHALRTAGAKDVTYLRIKDAPHHVYTFSANQTYVATETFFDRILMGNQNSEYVASCEN